MDTARGTAGGDTADGDKGGGEGGDPDVVVAGGGSGVQRRADCVAAARGRRVIAKATPPFKIPLGGTPRASLARETNMHMCMYKL